MHPAAPFTHSRIRRLAAVLGLVLPILAPLANRVGLRSVPHLQDTGPVAAVPTVDHFSRYIQPVLRTRCISCHGDEAPAGGLSLTTREQLLAGGDHGAGIVPGQPEQSLLYRRISQASHGTGRMPPGGEGLPAPVIERFATWIRTGAPWLTERGQGPGAETTQHPTPNAQRLNHWAFQPLRRPAPPVVRNESWVRTPIDRFVLAELERKQLIPAPRAARRQLVRRLYFDILGLPPTPEEVAQFLQECEAEDREHHAPAQPYTPRAQRGTPPERPRGTPPEQREAHSRAASAYERLVDRLLASPHYGERWGRYWLDLARYADSSGYEADRDRPSAYPYRDWVIRALNDDMPYDQFVKRQIAGDLYPPANALAAAATGFCTSAPTVEPGGSKKDRLDELDDLVSTTSTAFLGLTIGCARCHDHKFDPVSQRDYYGLVSVFAGTRRTERALDPAAEARFERQTTAYREKVAAARRRFDDWLKLQRITHADFRSRTHRRTMDLMQRLTGFELEGAIEVATQNPPQRPSSALSLCGAGGTPTPLYAGGDPERPGPLVDPAVPALFGATAGSLRDNAAAPRVAPRVALAEWLVDPERSAHRLTARVIVNRVWQHHFGQGLVRTPSDFGLQSDAPSHPELLDWLAATFSAGNGDQGSGAGGRTVVANAAFGSQGSVSPQNWGAGGAGSNYAIRTTQYAAPATRRPAPASHEGLGWKLKALHKLILTSAVYMQGTRWDAAQARRDPENRLLWRRSPQRLDAEAIRDAMLVVSGSLNEQMYGPGIRPRIPAEAIFKSEEKYGELWPGNIVDGPSTWRRSIYVFVKRAQPLPILQTFDAPEAATACSQRTVSTVAPQALALLNDPFVRDQAERLAARIRRAAGNDPRAQIDRLYHLALSRSPRATEQDACLQFLARGRSVTEVALADLCQSVMGLNEFIYVD